MSNHVRTLILLGIAALLPACHSITAPGDKPSAVQSESEKVNALLDEMFMEFVERSPETQTALGIKRDYDKWDDLSEAHAHGNLELAETQLGRLQRIDASRLDAHTRLSVRLYKRNLGERIADFRWRDHNHPVNQMFGVHTNVPSLLINQHRVDSVEDARDYIARLQAVPELFDQLIEGLWRRAEEGIVPPAFVFPHVRRDCNNIISGRPFDGGEDSALLADFRDKVTGLDIPEADKKRLLEDAIEALRGSVEPAYRRLLADWAELEKRADSRAGVWKWPDGEAFYENALRRTTTTDLSAGRIHRLGLEEVERIHGEMREIMRAVDFDGDLQAFFEFMRTDPRFYYPDTPAGRRAYLDRTREIIETMRGRLDELFLRKPGAALTVKPVEAFREQSAGKAFYQQPAPDGSRPGIYYVNLHKMADMPNYQLEALAYHEAIPGHHMQIAIAQELEDIPLFRRHSFYTAYVEGWGLYAELLPREIGLYRDPYSDFGRLAMELWRACRLVVDTGIHDRRWTRQQAIDYLMANTPNSPKEVEKAIERYIVMPSQATAYKVGMMKILELRERARVRLGTGFDVRAFHDVVLRHGAVPLDTLENLVEEWAGGAPQQAAPGGVL